MIFYVLWSEAFDKGLRAEGELYEDEAGLFQMDMSVADLACQVGAAATDAEHIPEESYVNLTLTDDEDIRGINRAYRGLDQATDVLSFPNIEFEAPGAFPPADTCEADYMDPDEDMIFLGDIIISTDHVAAQAREYGHGRKRELAFLIAHSLLHLWGYDHMEEAEAAVMEERQRMILQRAGIERV